MGRLTAEQEETIKRMIDEGASTSKIMEVVGCCQPAVLRRRPTSKQYKPLSPKPKKPKPASTRHAGHPWVDREIQYRDLDKPEWCDGCEKWISIRPCPACIARESERKKANGKKPARETFMVRQLRKKLQVKESRIEERRDGLPAGELSPAALKRKAKKLRLQNSRTVRVVSVDQDPVPHHDGIYYHVILALSEPVEQDDLQEYFARQTQRSSKKQRNL